MILSGVRVLKNALVLYDSKENPSIAVCTTFFPQFLQLFPTIPIKFMLHFCLRLIINILKNPNLNPTKGNKRIQSFYILFVIYF